ncbi:MAG: hypothetical protein CMJ64_12285 [Planctomycetaceae bacterium]|nr:hypothetical protein [Planctomycetaceae bacterium]
MKRFFHSAMMCSVVLAVAMGGVARAQDDDDTERILVDKLPKYWIGVHAIPIDDVLKSHLQLEDRLIVSHVVSDSPAEEAGLKQHDILLKFSDAKISSLDDLMAAVKAAETSETRITILRGGKEKTLSLTPTERPATIAEFPIDRPFRWRRLDDWMDANDAWRRFRVVGPGVFLDRRAEELPDGVTINITKENDEPAKITVKRGEDSWDITEDSLDKLPDDLRERVERHLRRPGNHELRGRAIFKLDPDDGEIHLQPHRFVPENFHPQLNQALRRLEQFQRRFDKDDPFKALQEQIEALRQEVEKLREDRPKDEAKPDGPRDA